MILSIVKVANCDLETRLPTPDQFARLLLKISRVGEDSSGRSDICLLQDRGDGEFGKTQTFDSDDLAFSVEVDDDVWPLRPYDGLGDLHSPFEVNVDGADLVVDFHDGRLVAPDIQEMVLTRFHNNLS